MAKSSTRLVLICGLPASGKSTLARQLAPKIPAIRLDKDGWATQLGADLWDQEFRVRLEHQLWALSQDLLARGQSVILEWGHWARVERDEKRLGARALGVGVELHYLDAPLEELIERAERRNASGEWTASPMTRAHFERWATIFQPPDEEEILAELLPRNLAVQVFRALLENAASEQGARMSAMDNATRNAGDMIGRLTLKYNRTRQAMITKELIEIISGAEAL